MFTGGSSEKFRIAPDQVQIDTTHYRPQHHVKSAVSATNIAVNRTAVRAYIILTGAGIARSTVVFSDEGKRILYNIKILRERLEPKQKAGPARPAMAA
jgi:hypothetical protein